MVVKIWIGTQIDGIILDIMDLNTMERKDGTYVGKHLGTSVSDTKL